METKTEEMKREKRRVIRERDEMYREMVEEKQVNY